MTPGPPGERAQSITLTHVLALGISAVLVSGLLVGSTALLETQRESVALRGATDISSGVATDLTELDQFDTDTLESTVAINTSYPERIAGETYRIGLEDAGGLRARLHVNVSGTGVSVTRPVRLQTEVCGSGRTVSGGTIILQYEHDDDCLDLQGVS